MGSTGVSSSDSTAETTREACAVFASVEALQAAVDALLSRGFRRADLSVLGSEATIAEKFGGKVPDARALADDSETPRGTFVSSDTRAEEMGALAGIPVYLGGAGAAAVAALAGATVIATAGAALGAGLAAGALGLYAARRMEKRHVDQIDRHLDHGGLVLWVRTGDKEREVEALEVLRNNGGDDLRVHTVTLPWGVDAVPFHDAQPDPFLSKD